jgi:hypothetical protein
MITTLHVIAAIAFVVIVAAVLVVLFSRWD